MGDDGHCDVPGALLSHKLAQLPDDVQEQMRKTFSFTGKCLGEQNNINLLRAVRLYWAEEKKKEQEFLQQSGVVPARGRKK